MSILCVNTWGCSVTQPVYTCINVAGIQCVSCGHTTGQREMLPDWEYPGHLNTRLSCAKHGQMILALWIFNLLIVSQERVPFDVKRTKMNWLLCLLFGPWWQRIWFSIHVGNQLQMSWVKYPRSGLEGRQVPKAGLVPSHPQTGEHLKILKFPVQSIQMQALWESDLSLLFFC